MHLVDLLALRPLAAAGVYLALTRRCPLTCAHCSTNSLTTSEEHSEDIFLPFVDSFSAPCRPEVLILTGGEPLLRAGLVRRIKERAQTAGTRVGIISGMFFARQSRTPHSILEALDGMDHFIASLDVFHEQQVPRAAVFRVLHELRDRGQEVSVHVVGRDENDPYLAEVLDDLERDFDGQVPAMVAQVKPVGRARTFLGAQGEDTSQESELQPCGLAAWPVVSYDGSVVACTNQSVVDGPPPPHLRLGHSTVDNWETIRARCLTRSMVRALRVFGPLHVATEYGSGKVACSGFCTTCQQLSNDPQIAARIETRMTGGAIPFLEQRILAAQQATFPYGIPKYEHYRNFGDPPGPGERRRHAAADAG